MLRTILRPVNMALVAGVLISELVIGGWAMTGEIDPAQNKWFEKYKKQQNIPQAEDMLLNTDAEPDVTDGFTPMFNGTDLSGWSTKGGTCRFEAKDGLVVGTCVPGSSSTYLCTEKNDYRDFIFTCDMKWEVDGNSGVMFRAQIKSDGNTETVFGPQAEMEGITGDRYWNGGIYGQSCGGYFYPLWLTDHQQARAALNRTGWNRLTIMAHGNVVKTWVNGVPAAHWVDDGTYSRGFFGLQIHKGNKGTVLWKNVRIRELTYSDPEQWVQPSFWTTQDGKPATESWEFSDDEIRLTQPRGGKGNLLSPPLPPHFELSFKWKIGPQANSGLKYRVRQFGGRWLGVEYQMIDEAIPLASPHKGATASIYDLEAPILDKPLNPAGTWNEARIVAVGTEIKHYLNGAQVAQASIAGARWQADIARSKFYGLEGFAQPTEGDRVMLTDHGGQTVFKDFQFVALEAPPEPSLRPVAPQLGNAMRNGWADQTSIVIWTRTTQHPEMVTSGPQFITLPDRPGNWTDAGQLLTMQLPEGVELDEMLGACPGAPGEVRLTYFPQQGRNDSQSTSWTRTHADRDYTAQWKLDNLKPGTLYAAIVEARPIDGQEVTAVVRGSFRTAPAMTESPDLKFCMTTCHDFERRDDGLKGHKIYPAMTAINPDFVVHAGDIEYYDKPHPWAWTVELMRFKWARIFSLPRNREFYANRTTYFIKDDHDTLKNDCWAGQSYGAVSFDKGVELFNKEQFPTRSPRYHTISWGQDVQIWLLEGRDYRSPNTMPDGPDKTILGPEQKAWLFDTVSRSTARFKLVFSPTPIVGPDRNNKKDNHANQNFAHEGNELREFFGEIENVIVFCGDRHWQYASVDDESGLWEFGCGPGSEKHQLGWKEGDVRPVHRFLRVQGGFLSGEVTHSGDQDTPTLTLRHHDVNGKKMSEFQFPQQHDSDPE